MSLDIPAAEIRKRFDAKPEKLFSAFASPDLVSRWLKPAPEIGLVVLSFDFRVGGDFRFAYHVTDGQIMTVNGRYRRIDPPSRIEFSWNVEPPDEHAGLRSEVIIAIMPDGEGSELHIRHEKLTLASSLDRHQGGWEGALGLLAELLDLEKERNWI